MTQLSQFIASDVAPQLPLLPGARRLTRVMAGAAAATLVALLVGCAAEVVKERPRPVWPEPPETARIEFIRTLVDDKDLVKDSTSSQTLFKFLAGDVAAQNRIVEPMGLTTSPDGHRLYISDFAQAKVFVFDFEKKTSLAVGLGKLAAPMGVALDAAENIYVADSGRKGVQVFDPKGEPLLFITDDSVERPVGLALDVPRGKIYVADSGRTGSQEHSVKIFDLQGKLLGKIGNQIGEIPGSFLFPTYLTVDAQGNLYVADTLNSRVQKFDSDGKFLQAFGKRGNGFGMFDKPKGVGVDSFGNLYVVDSGWSNVQIFNAKGDVLMFFGGRGTAPGLLQNPAVMTIDKNNRIYVGDVLNHRVSVYQLINTTAEDAAIKAAAEAPKAESAK
jgi:DNA-binding beta-propeller fold protein YncE